MRRLAFLLLLVPACAPRYRTETLGKGTAGGAGVTLTSAGPHTVSWAVSTPRALQLHWAIACGGATIEGDAGETFDAYKERRLNELRAEKKSEQDALASLIGTAGAAAKVETPSGEADAEVHADGHAVADAVISDDVALPAGDVGATIYRGTTSLSATEPGACTMTVAPIDAAEDAAGVVAEFEVTRTIDLDAERRQEYARRRDGAIEVRGELSAQLVALGADPDHQRKVAEEVAASLRVKADLDAQAQAELDAQEQTQLAVTVESAIAVRDRLRAQLIALGADPDYQAHLVDDRDAELRVDATLDARVDVVVDAQLDAEVAARGVRDRLRAQLIAFGADPDFQAKRIAQRDAELRLRADEEARVRADRDARLRADEDAARRAEEETRAAAWAKFDAAIEIRARLTAQLIALGADPDFQAKRAAAIEADLRVRADADSARLRAEQDARDRAYAERQRRHDGALAVRAELLAYLEGLGAFAIPAMPEPLYEDQGDSPGSGSVWIAGEWTLQGREWVWISGGWSIPTTVADTDTTVSNDTQTDAGVSGGVSIDVKIPVIVIDRDDPPPPRPKRRDHRK